MNIQEFRQKYPEYKDIPDQQLAEGLHQKYYSDMKPEEFNAKFLGTTAQKESFSPTDFMLSRIKDVGAKGLGMLETGANLFSSAYGVPASGLAMIAGLPFGKSQEWGEATAKTLISEPKTEAGKEMTGMISWPFEKLSQGAGKVADITREVTGSPEVAAGVGTVIEASPLLLGMKKGKVFTPKEKMQIDLYKKGFPITKGTLAESIGEKVPPGSAFFKNQRAELNKMVLESNKQFVTEELGLPSPQLKPQVRTLVKEAWEGLNKEMPREAPVSAPNIQTWIDSNLSAIPKSEKWLLNDLDKIRTSLAEKGTVEFGQLGTLPATLWGKKYMQLPKHLQGKLGQLRQALSDDIQILQETSGKPVFDAFQNAMEKSQMPHRIRLAETIEELLNKATVFSPEREMGIFNPAKFQQLVDANMGRIEAIAPKNSGIPEMVKAYSEKMLLTSSDLAKLAREKSAMGQLANRVGNIATTGGIGSLGPLGVVSPATAAGIAVPWGFETAMAHSLAHPRGWLKKFVFRESRPFQGTGKAVAAGTVLEGGQE